VEEEQIGGRCSGEREGEKKEVAAKVGVGGVDVELNNPKRGEIDRKLKKIRKIVRNSWRKVRG